MVMSAARTLADADAQDKAWMLSYETSATIKAATIKAATMQLGYLLDFYYPTIRCNVCNVSEPDGRRCCKAGSAYKPRALFGCTRQ